MDSYPITNRSNMFGTTLSIAAFAFCCATVCNSAELSASSTMSTKPTESNMETTTASIKFDDINYNDVMNVCNATFRVSMGNFKLLTIYINDRTFLEYLSELNSTGSFPDETDKTPMVTLYLFLFEFISKILFYPLVLYKMLFGRGWCLDSRWCCIEGSSY